MTDNGDIKVVKSDGARVDIDLDKILNQAKDFDSTSLNKTGLKEDPTVF